MDSASLLTTWENCERAGIWSLEWEKYKLTPTQMLQRGVQAGVTESQRKDWGEVAGESLYALGIEPGILSDQHDIHSEVVHLACIADIVSCAVRRPGEPPWNAPATLPSWTPENLYLSPDGSYLRRLVFVTSWSDDRHYSVCRSWASLGPVCHYGMPMQLVVVVLGNHRNGRYHSFWSRGLRHPVSKKLRFRKKNDIGTPFKESWIEAWRSDYDEISTEQWLSAMHSDGVLTDCCFKLDIPVPDKAGRDKIVELAARKMEKIESITTLPDQNLSTCDWPTPCCFRSACHKGDSPNGKYGFVRVE